MFKIRHKTADPFAIIIDNFVAREFPRSTQKPAAQVVELLTEEIFATNKIRLGPKPSPEIQVAIRQVIRDSVASSKRIPFMVPWGSEKPDGSSIDVAELAAIKTLSCLAARIGDYYLVDGQPGVEFRIRIEDASAPHLFFEDPATARANAARYTGDFLKLLKVLDVESFITPVPESMFTTEAAFNAEADPLIGYFERYLFALQTGEGLDLASDSLTSFGWTGGIALETATYYLGQYMKLYPEKSNGERIHILARYYAGALARRRLKIRGDAPEWNGQFLDLSFAASPPGTENYFGRRVTYRTMPSNLTSQHIPPWRAKWYLLMPDGEQAIPKLSNFWEVLPFNPHSVTLHGTDGTSVDIQTDYLVP